MLKKEIEIIFSKNSKFSKDQKLKKKCQNQDKKKRKSNIIFFKGEIFE